MVQNEALRPPEGTVEKFNMAQSDMRGPYRSMGRPIRSRWMRYGFAVMAVGIGWGLRQLMVPLIGPEELPFIFFLLAIVLVAGFGGLRPALFATLLSAAVARWCFFEPRHDLSIQSFGILAALGIFCLVAAIISFSIESVYREKDLLATTLRSIGDAVIVTDGDRRIRFLNAEAERLTGWDLSEARGKPLPTVFRIIDEYTRAPLADPAAEALREGKVTDIGTHTVLVTKDGKELPIDDSVAPIRDISERLVGAVLVFRDISEKREAERSASRLAAIVENSDDAIISKDLNGTITSWNKAAQRIFGYTAEEIIGTSVRNLIPAGRQEEETHILAALQAGERVEHLETLRKRKDGKALDVLLSTSPIKNAEGKVIGASTIAHDITKEKAMEVELERAHEELQNYARKLESTVAERTAHLQATIAELEGVSYSLSHDMRAPLRTIQSFSQIVLAEADGNLGPMERGLLQKIINAAERLDRLIQDVLIYSKVAREKIDLKPVDVERLLRQVLAERPDLQMPKAVIEMQSPLMPVCAHEAYLSQCITNLLDNGVKFVAAGTQPKVTIRSESRDNRVRLWFEDNGIGIPAESQKRIFGLFERLHTQTAYPGTGIGLSIVRKAAERMGGKVGVESEPGRGSRFWLELKKVEP